MQKIIDLLHNIYARFLQYKPHLAIPLSSQKFYNCLLTTSFQKIVVWKIVYSCSKNSFIWDDNIFKSQLTILDQLPHFFHVLKSKLRYFEHAATLYIALYVLHCRPHLVLLQSNIHKSLSISPKFHTLKGHYWLTSVAC